MTENLADIRRDLAPRQRGARPALSPPPSSQRAAAEATAESATILLLAADPLTLPRLRLETELREIAAGLASGRHRDRYHVASRVAVRALDLHAAMLEKAPRIVHFCGHGGGAAGVILVDDRGGSHPLSTRALANLFRLFAAEVRCVVLNSCHSQAQAEAIAEHIPYVVGMASTIDDRSAIVFASSFYKALGEGYEIPFAVEAARSAIELANLPDHTVPVLMQGRAREAAANGGALVSGPQPELQTYLYISAAKLQMLMAQIPSAAIAELCRALALALPTVAAAHSDPERADSKHAMLKIVDRYLATSGEVGTIDQPRDYFRGELRMRWGDVGREVAPSSPLVYFAGETHLTVVGLGGSLRHVIGGAESGRGI